MKTTNSDQSGNTLCTFCKLLLFLFLLPISTGLVANNPASVLNTQVNIVNSTGCEMIVFIQDGSLDEYNDPIDTYLLIINPGHSITISPIADEGLIYGQNLETGELSNSTYYINSTGQNTTELLLIEGCDADATECPSPSYPLLACGHCWENEVVAESQGCTLLITSTQSTNGTTDITTTTGNGTSIELSINLGEDQAKCWSQSPVSLFASKNVVVNSDCEHTNTAITYLWSNGETSQSIIVEETGTYSVTATTTILDCEGTLMTCEVTTEVYLFNETLTVTILSDGIISCDNPVNLSVETNLDNVNQYHWSGPMLNSTDASIQVTEPGTYNVMLVSEVGCIANGVIDVYEEDCNDGSAGIGNFVFIDVDNNGIYEDYNGDTPFAGVSVNLYEAGDLNNAIATTLTDDSGNYQFLELNANTDYVIGFAEQEGYTFTPQVIEGISGVDNVSDADSLGLTAIINLNAGEIDSTIDAGFTPMLGYVNIKALLQGPAESLSDGDVGDFGAGEDKPGLGGQGGFGFKAPQNWYMNDKLKQSGMLPMTEPYSSMSSYNYITGAGANIDDTDILTSNGPDGVVDWIFVELRDPKNPKVVISTRGGLIRRDGTVVDEDGNKNIAFAVPYGTYFVAVHHRNHLAVMTDETYIIGGLTPAQVDFTNPNTPTYGEYAQAPLDNNTMALWAGDTNEDGQIVFQGINNDTNAPFFDVVMDPANSFVQTNFVSNGYKLSDIDMNSNSIYQGLVNDPNILFFNSLSHPLNTLGTTNFIIKEQLPEWFD